MTQILKKTAEQLESEEVARLLGYQTKKQSNEEIHWSLAKQIVSLQKQLKELSDYNLKLYQQTKPLSNDQMDENWEKIMQQADVGKDVIENLPSEFKKQNYGKFVAVTLSGKILLCEDTLDELNEELNNIDLDENYYVTKIGFKTITEI